ncbi:acyl-CoA reductase-like NAD-dependent aldehyde dehydrogenase [Sphingomonas zeicaulis]
MRNCLDRQRADFQGALPVSASVRKDRLRRAIATGKMLNAGQICLAPDYMLVPEDRIDEAAEGLRRTAAAMYPRLIDNPDYGAVINGCHHGRLAAHLDDARAKGARLVEVNPAGDDFAAANTRKLPLTLVLDPADRMRVMQEEIFEPILPIRPYRRIEEAIAYVNRRDRPFGLYYFGTDHAEERLVLDRTISGGVTVKDVLFNVSREDLPFGGIGASGMDHYHGQDGFRTFTHAGAVYRQPKLDIAALAGLKPPYGAALRRNVAREFR